MFMKSRRFAKKEGEMTARRYPSGNKKIVVLITSRRVTFRSVHKLLRKCKHN